MTHVTIGRWGKNLAVRFPSEISSMLHLREGERVEIDGEADRITIRRVRPRYTLAELFAGKTAEEWRSLYRDAYDWGPDRGREVVEE